MSTESAKENVAVLATLKVKGDVMDADSFLDYTKEWTQLQNRGGLFVVTDRCCRLFQAMEIQTRKHLSDDLLVEGRSKPIQEILNNELLSNVHVCNMWDALHGDELVDSDGLFRKFVHYWIDIRFQVAVKLFLEKKKGKATSKGEKGLRKELSKK
ncbi:uncharacterized protein [Diadema antillarum]|uniref:uncharacterized protein n=1 Tax=Diadema antillarum TaxID=105358 RepID=UPI003A854FE8